MPVALDGGGLFNDYVLHKVQALSADNAKMDALSLLGVQIHFNPLVTNDKGYCESFMLNIREIQMHCVHGTPRLANNLTNY